MTIKLANNAVSKLAAPVANTDLTFSITPGDGVKFPTLATGETFPLTLIRASDNAIEIVTATARAADTFTITRAQESTAALAFAAGDRVELRLTSASLTSLLNALFSHVNEFRLTLSSGVPVPTTDVAAATSVFCTPYKGNRIALYDGANWNIRTSAEFSLALGVLTANLVYDVFCYDNAGVPTLEFLAWTNTSTRATALAYQDGILVKSGAPTRRYLGSFYTIDATHTCDAETMAGATTGRFLYNYYNRVDRSMRVQTNTANWTIASTVGSFRQANSSNVYQLNYLIGVIEDSVRADVDVSYSTAAGTGSLVLGIGKNSTTASASPYGRTIGTSGYGSAHTGYKGLPALGLNYLAWLEMGNGVDTVTVSNYNAGVWQGAMQGEVRL